MIHIQLRGLQFGPRAIGTMPSHEHKEEHQTESIVTHEKHQTLQQTPHNGKE